MKCYLLPLMLSTVLIACESTKVESDVVPNQDNTSFSAERIHSNLSDGNLALQGYDPVAYINQQRVQKGSATITAEFDNIKYQFATEDNRSAFESSPERFVPQYGGWCATGMAFDLVEDWNWAAGKYQVEPNTFRVTDGKLYLFYNFPDYNAKPDWLANEEEMIRRADQKWQDILDGKD